MKKGNAMLKSIFNTAILFAVMCIFALVSCAPISDSAGAINGWGADSSNRNGVPITITLPSIKSKSASIRALTDEQRTRLERETAKYRVTFSSAGQTSTREGDGTTYSAYFPVGAQVGITVYCLNNNDEVIVETVTKTITVSSGANRLDFKLSEDGTEIILPPPPPPPTPPSVKSAVLYELDGGDWSPTSAPPQTEEYDEGATVTITTNEPTKQGFTFLGWKASVSSLIPSGGGDNFQAGSTFTMPSSAVTFTAQWTSLPTHTVTYDLGFQPSSGSQTSTAQVPEGATVSLTAPTVKRVGYEFEYWMYNQAQAPSGLTMGNSDITLTASWTVAQYTINIATNGATSVTQPFSGTYTIDGSNQTQNEIGLAPLQPGDYVYSKKVCDGWAYTQALANAGTKIVRKDVTPILELISDPNVEISSSNVITLYPVWKDAAASVTGNSGPEEFYDTLEEAWEGANTGGSADVTVKMYADASVTATLVQTGGYTITLDLNGRTLDGSGVGANAVIELYGIFTLQDTSSTGAGTIKGASSTAIRVESSGSMVMFNMNGGKITGVTNSGNGGGVYVGAGGTFNMNGGTITGNTAADGGGVYVEQTATFNISGNVNITGNQKTGGAASNVYLDGTINGGAMITLTGTLNAASRIGVTLSSVVVTSGWYTYKGLAVATTVFTSDVAGMIIGEMQMQLGPEVVLQNKAASLSTNGGAEQFYPSFGEAWAAMEYAVNNVDPDVPYVVKMYESATVTSTLEPAGADVTLDLNGFTLDGSGLGSQMSVISVSFSGEFTLADSSSQASGVIEGASYAAVFVGGGNFTPTFNMTGGEILGVNSSDAGGGVRVGVGGTFNMSGGIIIGNTASDGGGVYVESSGTFNILGYVTITNNQKTSGAASNVHLAGTGSAMINLTGTLNAGSSIGVSVETPGIFTSGWSANKGTAATTVFTSDEAGKTVAESGNELALQ